MDVLHLLNYYSIVDIYLLQIKHTRKVRWIALHLLHQNRLSDYIEQLCVHHMLGNALLSASPSNFCPLFVQKPLFQSDHLPCNLFMDQKNPIEFG